MSERRVVSARSDGQKLYLKHDPAGDGKIRLGKIRLRGKIRLTLKPSLCGGGKIRLTLKPSL